MTCVISKLMLFCKYAHFMRFLFTSPINYANKKPLKLAYKKYNEKIVKTSRNPPLLILHGLMGCKSNWHTISNNLIEKLNLTRSIVTLDARNHGQSPHDSDISYEAMTEDLKLFIDTEISVKHVALMGHSMGGLTTLLFALKWPELVEKLILIDVSPIMPETETKTLTHIVNVLKLMRSFPLNKKPTTLTKERQKLYHYLKREVPNKRTRQFLLKNLTKSNGNIKWQLNIPALMENAKEYKNFPNLIGKQTYKGPTCIIAGTNSKFLRKSDHPEIKKLLPNVQFKYIENAGHWPHYEQPDEFLKIVMDNLKI